MPCLGNAADSSGCPSTFFGGDTSGESFGGGVGGWRGRHVGDGTVLGIVGGRSFILMALQGFE